MISDTIAVFDNYITSIFVKKVQTSMVWYHCVPGILLIALYCALCMVVLVKLYEKTSKYVHTKFHIQPYHERQELRMLPEQVSNVRLVASTQFTRKRIIRNAIYLDSVLKRRYQLRDYYWKTHDHDFD